jgi:hypothetical protein
MRTLCLVRLPIRGAESELTADRINLSEGVIIFESLKKRKKGIYRAVPVPLFVLDALELVHSIKEKGKGGASVAPWNRSTAWRYVKAIMDLQASLTSLPLHQKAYVMGLALPLSVQEFRSTCCKSG